jgi:hypothetical protein
MNIDDAWQGKRGGPFQPIQGNDKLPDMQGLCDTINAMGLKVGIAPRPGLHPVLVVAREGDLRVYAKDLEDGSKAVGLFNLGTDAVSVTVKWSDLRLTGIQSVRDLWRQKDLGAFEAHFQLPVAAHGGELLKLRPTK